MARSSVITSLLCLLLLVVGFAEARLSLTSKSSSSLPSATSVTHRVCPHPPSSPTHEHARVQFLLDTASLPNVAVHTTSSSSDMWRHIFSSHQTTTTISTSPLLRNLTELATTNVTTNQTSSRSKNYDPYILVVSRRRQCPWCVHLTTGVLQRLARLFGGIITTSGQHSSKQHLPFLRVYLITDDVGEYSLGSPMCRVLTRAAATSSMSGPNRSSSGEIVSGHTAVGVLTPAVLYRAVVDYMKETLPSTSRLVLHPDAEFMLTQESAGLPVAAMDVLRPSPSSAQSWEDLGNDNITDLVIAIAATTTISNSTDSIGLTPTTAFFVITHAIGAVFGFLTEHVLGVAEDVVCRVVNTSDPVLLSGAVVALWIARRYVEKHIPFP
eukprot:PhM_4_TR10945/c0_g1_i2/m.8081